MTKQTYIVGLQRWGKNYGETITLTRTIRAAWKAIRKLWDDGTPYISNWAGTRYIWPMRDGKYKDGRTAKTLIERGKA